MNNDIILDLGIMGGYKKQPVSKNTSPETNRAGYMNVKTSSILVNSRKYIELENHK